MGYVFSIEDFLKGKIPQKEDYKNARAMLEHSLKLLRSSFAIWGALIYGSISNEPGSDIDCLVIYRENGLEYVKEEVQKIKEKTNVPLEIIPLDVEDANKGHHTIDKPFKQYLQAYVQKRGFIGEDPIKEIKNSQNNYIQEIRKGLLIYQHSLEKRFVNVRIGKREYYNFLENILEKPVHTARYMLQSLSFEVPRINGSICENKKEIHEVYSKHFPKKLSGKLKRILLMEKEYRRFLQVHAKEKNGEKYVKLLEKISEFNPVTLSFIKENISRI